MALPAGNAGITLLLRIPVCAAAPMGALSMLRESQALAGGYPLSMEPTA